MNVSAYRWFKHQYPGTFVELFGFLEVLVTVFCFFGDFGKRSFLEVLVTGIVTNRKQKIPSQITGKIMFKPVVLKLVGSTEPNRCHASIHRTLNYNQERSRNFMRGDAVLNQVEC